jgi:fatty acid desaturase
MGLLDRRPGYYRMKITLTIVAFFAVWALFVIVGNSWLTLAVAPLVGIMFTQLGFLGHDAGHNQVFCARRRNRLLGLIVGNALIGLSFGWWVPKHNAHHAHPNEMGRDPDVGEGFALAPSDAPGNGPGPVASWLARWQAPLFFPLMLLRSGGMHVLGIKRLARRRDRASAVEGALIVLHAALYLSVVLWVLSPVKALAFIVVQQAVFSVYLGVSFAPNHKGMPIIESGTAAGFARRQVVTARNIRGGLFTTFMLGGLNRQIEHHLFPSMPRPNLPRVQGMVRDFCVAADLGYSEESFVGSFSQIVHHLSAAGAAVGRRGLPKDDGDDQRPAGSGRQEHALGQAQVTAALGLDDEPAEQDNEHGSHDGTAVAAQEQRPRWCAPGDEGGPHRDNGCAERGPGEVWRGRALSGFGKRGDADAGQARDGEQDAGRQPDAGQARGGYELTPAHQEQGPRHDPPIGAGVAS